MVQKLNRLIGRADFRVLSFITMFTVLVTIGWTYAQFADESTTVNSYKELVDDYLSPERPLGYGHFGRYPREISPTRIIEIRMKEPQHAPPAGRGEAPRP